MIKAKDTMDKTLFVRPMTREARHVPIRDL